MGSLLRMNLAEQHLFKLTKSNCICQGEKTFFPRSLPEKISAENFQRESISASPDIP
jgi:hypothetical protein